MVPGDVFIASHVPRQAQNRCTACPDRGHGHRIGSIDWHDYSPTARGVEWGVTIHRRRRYDRANQSANPSACPVLIGMTIAGAVLWWKRRPRGRLGAPARIAHEPLPRGIVTTRVTLVLLLLLLGATLIPVALFDAYAATRFRGLGRPTA